MEKRIYKLGLFAILAAACEGGSEKANFAAIFAAEVNGQSAPTDEGAEAEAEAEAESESESESEAEDPGAYNGPEFCVDLNSGSTQETVTASACNNGDWTVMFDENTVTTVTTSSGVEGGVLEPDVEDGYEVTVRVLTPGWRFSGTPNRIRLYNGEQTVLLAFTSDAIPPTCDPNAVGSPCHQCDPEQEDCNGNMITPDCSEPGGSCNPNHCSLLVRARAGSEGGDPIAGAEVRIQGDGNLEPQVTDDEGEVLAENLPCRPLTVDVSADTYGAQSVDVDLGATTDAVVTFPLQPLATDELVWTEWLPPCDAGDAPLPLHTIPVFLNGMVLLQDDLEYSSVDETLLTVDAGECDGNPDTTEDVCYTCLVAGIGQVEVLAIDESLTTRASVEIRTIE